MHIEAIGAPTIALLFASACSSTVDVVAAAQPLDTSGWVAVLGTGKQYHPSCVHGVPDGAHIAPGDHSVRTSNGVVIGHYVDCEYAPKQEFGLGNGWVMSTENVPASGLTLSQMSNQWIVPSLPASHADNQIVGLYSSFQYLPTDGPGAIIQPVLFFGTLNVNPVTGGHEQIGNWSSWTYIDMEVDTNNNVWVSYPGITVNVGDTLLSQISTQFAENNGVCLASGTLLLAADQTTNQSVLMWPPYYPWNHAETAVLEEAYPYGVQSCMDWPANGSVTVSALSLNQWLSGSCSSAPPLNGGWQGVYEWNVPNGIAIPDCQYNVAVDPGIGGATLSWATTGP